MTDLTRPVAGQSLLDSDGAGTRSTVLIDAAFDVIEANEDAITARTSSQIVTTDAYPDLAAAALHSADSLSDATGVWGAVNAHLSSVVALDTTNKTSGTASVSVDLNRPSGSGTTGILYCNLVTPVSVGGHTDLDIDLRFTRGNGQPAPFGFEVFFASGAVNVSTGAVAGTVVTKAISTAHAENAWQTYSLPVGALTTIASFGVRKRSASAGASSHWVTWKIDHPEMSATSGMDAALATSPRAVLIPPGFSPAVFQNSKTLGTLQSLLDFRPSHTNLSNFRSIKNLRDWNLDETGTVDVTADLQTIVNSLSPFDCLTAPPTAKYRLAGKVELNIPHVTFDMQGSRFFAPAYTGDRMFQINEAARGCTLRNWRVFGRCASVSTTGNNCPAITGTTVVGSTRSLNAANDEMRMSTNLATNVLEEQFSRDEDGYIQWDINMQQSTPVTNDCTVWVTNHDYSLTFYTTTFTPSSTATVVPIKFRPTDLMSRMVLHIKKNGSGAAIVVNSILTYRPMRYNTTPTDGGDSTLNHGLAIESSGTTVENYWAEGMGGDGLNISALDDWTTRVRNYFTRGTGREGIVVTKGGDILIEDFVLGPCAREPVDIEPEQGTHRFIRNLRFRNGVIHSGLNIGFLSSGSWSGLHARRADRITLEDVWLRSYSSVPIDIDFSDGGQVRRIVYTWEGTGAAPSMNLFGNDMILEDIVSDGAIVLSGINNTLRRARVNILVQTGSLVVTGTGHHVQDIQIGSPDTVDLGDTLAPFDPPVIDTSLAFNPVILAADTTYDNIRCAFWKQEFGNSYKANTANGTPWWPRGLDMNGGGVRELRGISGSTTPANNLRGIAQAVTAASTSATVTFPPKTDHMNPTSFSISSSGPHTQRLTADTQVIGNSGAWQVTYNGQTTGKTITNAVFTPGTPWQTGDLGTAITNPFPRGVVTFTTSAPHDVLVGEDVGVYGTVSTGGIETNSFDNGQFKADQTVHKARTYKVASVPTSTTFTANYGHLSSGATIDVSSDPGTWVSGGTLGLGPDCGSAIVQRWLRALSTVADSDVTVTGTSLTTGGGTPGLTLTWNATLGDIPETMFSENSHLISWKNTAPFDIDLNTLVYGGFLTTGQYYVYRVAGRNFEGQPISGPAASMAAKVLLLAAGTNSITVSFGTPLYSTTTDNRVMGTTVWRAGPFVSNPGTYTGAYTKRVDLPGTQDLSFPAGGVDRETTFSGIPWTTLARAATTAELDQNQSGWEPDNNYAVWVTPSWPTPVAVTKSDTSLFQDHGSGFTVTFGVPAPTGGGTFDWGICR
jgi:hypothetical protein